MFVYWDTAGLPGNTASRPAKLPLAVLPAAAAPKVPFEQTLALLGIGFRLKSANDGSLNELSDRAFGPRDRHATIVRVIDGQVTRAEVANLDADGSPEIMLLTRPVRVRSVARGLQREQAQVAEQIHLPALTDSPAAAKGYPGRDPSPSSKARFVRRFPVYRDGDSNAAPSGGVRQLQYKLKPGEAGWVLGLDRVVEY